MESEKRPARYIVRVWSEQRGTVEFRPWAYSAEDAEFQIESELKKSSIRSCINYVGPVNPDCKCMNECRCGILAQ